MAYIIFFSDSTIMEITPTLFVPDLGALKTAAEVFVMENDRMSFKPFFETAERFMSRHHILVGGRVGIDLLLGRPLTRNSFYWELYCDETHKMSRELGRAIAETESAHIPARTTAVSTNIYGREYTIRVNTRLLFKLYGLSDRISAMVPTLRPGYFTNSQIKCIPEEIQLISIYRNLYSPDRADTWEDELLNEEKLFEGWQSPITGGRELLGRALARDLSLRIAKLPGIVIVGDWALDAIQSAAGNGAGKENNSTKDEQQKDNKSAKDKSVKDEQSKDNTSNLRLIDRPGRLQLIGSKSSVLESISKYPVKVMKYSPNLPDDFQLTKHTIFVNDNGERYPVCDIFNAADFEMIPYHVIDGKWYGAPYVLMRFVLIDLWIQKSLPGGASAGVTYIAQKAARLRKWVASLPADTDSSNGSSNGSNKPNKSSSNSQKNTILTRFQLTNYIGVTTKEAVAKKKLIKDIGIRHSTFYPMRPETSTEEN